MTKGRSPETNDKAADNAEHFAMFRASLEQQRKSFIPIGALSRHALAEGVRLLNSSHHLCSAAMVSSERPTLFLPLPSTLRAADVNVDDLLFVPYGWDTLFGGTLTISVALRGRGPKWIGRLYVAGTDPALDALEGGQLVCVMTKNLVPALAVEVDGRATSEASSLYGEQWNRAKTHLGVRTDPDARFWNTIKHLFNVSESSGLSPRDRLSIGWVGRYAEAVASLNAEVRAFQQLFAWPPGAAIPERWTEWCKLFRDGPLSVDALVDHFAKLHSDGTQKVWDQLDPAYHDAIHRVLSDHSPLCNAPLGAAEAFFLSSEMTHCGNRVPVLRGRDVGFHSIAPGEFATLRPEEYWPRILHLPAEWSSLVKPADVPADLRKGSELLGSMPKAEDSDGSIQEAEALLEEALAERKWTIPPGAVLDLTIGPFSQLELTERGASVDFVLRTEAGEFSAGGVGLAQDNRRIWWEALAVEDDDVARGPIAVGLYLMFAAAIRDFLVVEEREQVFGQRLMTRRAPKGEQEFDGPRVVYLPRVAYKGAADLKECRAALGHSDANRRAHQVKPHVRRCDIAAPAQIFLARRYGIDVPVGYTFVRPHERGKQARDVLYRSRSALQCLYRVTPSGARGHVAWFDFERDVCRAMGGLGFTIQHIAASGRGDRGVDIYASKGADLEQVCWVIQCKAYSATHKVGPHIVRELLGTLAEYPRGTRGMVATTSSFTRDAEQFGKQHGLRLMAGEEFAALLRSAATKPV